MSYINNEFEEEANNLMLENEKMIKELKLRVKKLKNDSDVYLNKSRLCSAKEFSEFKKDIYNKVASLQDQYEALWNYVKSSKNKKYARESSILSVEIQNVDEFSGRIKNCLHAERIFTISDLVQWSFGSLLKTPNLGRKSISEIRAWLKINNLSLKGEA